MIRGHLHWIDIVASVLLAGLAAVISVACYKQNASSGSLVLGGAALALFIGLGSPWRFRDSWGPSNVISVVIASAGLLVGFVSGLLLPMSIAWTALLWAWLSGRLDPRVAPRIARLLLLTLFIFPWVDVDIKPISWSMRISSAAAAQHALTLMDLETSRNGTMLYVSGRPVEVSEDCDGGETLHATLVVGLAAAFVYLGAHRRIWTSLPILCVFAWLANTLRILIICLALAWLPNNQWLNRIHDAGGWTVVALMLILCVAWFASCNRLNFLPRTVKFPRHWNGWTRIQRWREEGILSQWAQWGLVLACLALGLLWRSIPLPNAEHRLRLMPEAIGEQTCKLVPLTAPEKQRLGAAASVKRIYRCGNRHFLVTAIDGTANRRAVHDPTYCWTVTASSIQPMQGGTGTVLRVMDHGLEKEVLFWFSDGEHRHASPARYMLDTSLRRASLGWWGDEPLLLLIEPLDSTPVNWYRVLDRFPWLMDL